MDIIIAPDSFKGSLSATEAVEAMDRGIKRCFPHARTIHVPMADGGEGTMETLVAATAGVIKTVHAIDPLGFEITAEYGILGDEKTCVIEMAKASGLDLVPKEKLAPLSATTYGTGQLIKQALDDGYTSFILAIGGSATNDGGAGMLQALGLQLMDDKGKEIGYGGGELHRINRIDLEKFDERIASCKFVIASDVENPLIGTNGASYVFGPQKGADADDIKILDNNLTHWADMVAEVTGVHLHHAPGAGAAGGIGGAFQAFFPSEMQRGIDVVLKYSNFNAYLEQADIVLTGEGKVDHQTASGKTPMGVAQAAKKANIPTIIIAGSVGPGIEALYKYGVVSVNSMINEPMELGHAIQRASELLTNATEQIMRTYFSQ
ncbi:glycerate kinase family protein [Oceanobacillus alkalisoli]|uniref:glycerate kinase family protein n=1 Tax=Oceanobacillus alkalisoli TaxID=2925113 RepID=UPI001F11BAF8|nr:glycerate kinase [Oceanobacillus alkalisoli]MCF3942121.1 glycerate kinase [Oceanobacillus alkalisoli]